jgi:hypothetical protein
LQQKGSSEYPLGGNVLLAGSFLELLGALHHICLIFHELFLRIFDKEMLILVDQLENIILYRDQRIRFLVFDIALNEVIYEIINHVFGGLFTESRFCACLIWLGLGWCLVHFVIIERILRVV